MGMALSTLQNPKNANSGAAGRLSEKTWPGTKVLAWGALVFCFALAWAPLAPGTGGEASFEPLLTLAGAITVAGTLINAFYYLKEWRNFRTSENWPGTNLIGVGFLISLGAVVIVMVAPREELLFSELASYILAPGACLVPIGLMVNGSYAVLASKQSLRLTLLLVAAALALFLARERHLLFDVTYPYLALYSGTSLATHFVIAVRKRFRKTPAQP